MNMKINSQIELRVGEDVSPYHHPNALRLLEEELTFRNPKFTEAARLGFSTFSIPKDICLIKQVPGTWYIPRGHVKTVLSHFPDEPIQDFTSIGVTNSCLYMNEDFSLDERQLRCIEAMRKKKQGIILAATSSGKSAMILACIAEKQVSTLVIVNRKVLLEQLVSDAKKYLHNVPIGTLTGDKKDIQEVTFALDRTVANILEKNDKYADSFKSGFGMVIMDECHIAAAPTLQFIMNRMEARYRYGLSGSLNRKDGLSFIVDGLFGSVIAEVSKDEIIEAGRACPYSVHLLPVSTEVSYPESEESSTEYWKRIDKEIHASKEREDQVFDFVASLIRNGRTPAVGFRYLEPTKRLHKRLNDSGFPTSMLIGGVKEPKSICDEVQSGKTKCLVATFGTFSTGVNIPKLDALVIASPTYSNELLLNQLRGRILRNNPGKEKADVYFVHDEKVFPIQKAKRVVRILER